MSARAVISGLVLLAACTEPGEPQCTTNQSFGDTYVALGKEVTVRAGLSVSCFVPNVAVVDRPLRVVKEVDVEVLDPDNKKVPATASTPARLGGNTLFEVSTDVTFVLDRPGAWTVIARFEPSVGRSQQLVRVLDVRTDAGVRELTTNLPPTCTQFALTASGRLACVLPGGTPDTELVIDDQRFSGSDFALDGDAVWVLAPRRINGGAIERHAPTDAGPYAVTHTFPLGGAGSANGFAAGYGAAYLFAQQFTGGNDVVRFTPDDAGSFTQQALPVGSNRSALAVAPGPDRLMVLAVSFTGGQQLLISHLPDGGTHLTSAGFQGGAIAYGDGMLWTFGSVGTSTTTAQVAGFEGNATGVVTASATVQSTFVLNNPRMSPQAPVVRVPSGPGESRAVLPVLRDGELALEAFDPGPGYGELVSATRRHAFARSQDGTKVKVFDR